MKAIQYKARLGISLPLSSESGFAITAYRIQILFLLLSTMATAEMTLDIHGFFRDGYTDAPIQGAIVTVAELGLSDTSKVDGRFSLKNGSTSLESDFNVKPPVSQAAFSQGRFRFSNEKSGPITVRIFDLFGKQVFSS